MIPEKRISLTIISFLFLTDILETFTQFCFKKGALLAAGIRIDSLSALRWLGIG